jgi:hypothetical protein
MDRHTSTGKQPKQRKKKRNRQQTRQEEKKYKCTCHVYGQTHQYGGKEQESEPKKEKLEPRCAV